MAGWVRECQGELGRGRFVVFCYGGECVSCEGALFLLNFAGLVWNQIYLCVESFTGEECRGVGWRRVWVVGRWGGVGSVGL